MKWLKYILILILLIPFVSSDTFFYTQDYNNPLTRSIADSLYCQVAGDCYIKNLNVNNITVNGDVFNVSVVNYNVTGNFTVNGELVLTESDRVWNRTNTNLSPRYSGDDIYLDGGNFETSGAISSLMTGPNFLGLPGPIWYPFYLRASTTPGLLTDAWLAFNGVTGNYEFGLTAGNAMTISTGGAVVASSTITGTALTASTGAVTATLGNINALAGDMAAGGGDLTLGGNAYAGNPQIAWLTDGNDGGIIWDRGNDYFSFNDGINMVSSEPIFFRDLSSMFISGTSDTVLRMESPQAIQMDAFQFTFGPGGNADTWIFFDGTNQGRFDWDQDVDRFKYYDDLLLIQGEKLYLNESVYIYADDSNSLLINASNSVFNTNITVIGNSNFNENVTISGYLNATGNVYLTGTEGSNANKVGIGTGNPAYQLTITRSGGGGVRGLMITQHSNAVAAPLAVYRKSRGTETVPLDVNAGDFGFSIFGSHYQNGAYHLTTSLCNVAESADGTDVYAAMTFGAGNEIVSCTSDEKMRLSSAGYLGIATSDPSSWLTIGDDTDAVRFIDIKPGTAAGGFRMYNDTTNIWTNNKIGGSNDYNVYNYNVNAHPRAFVINYSNSFVGLSIRSPTSKLHVNGSTNITQDLFVGVGNRGNITSGYNVFFNVTDEISIPATALRVPTANSPEQTVRGVFPVSAFSAVTVESLYASIHVPSGYRAESSWRPEIYWSPSTNTSGNVSWCIEYRGVTPGERELLTGPTYFMCSVCETLNNQSMPLECSLGTISGVGTLNDDQFGFRVFRNATQTNDTYNADADFIDLQVYFNKYRLGNGD